MSILESGFSVGMESVAAGICPWSRAASAVAVLTWLVAPRSHRAHHPAMLTLAPGRPGSPGRPASPGDPLGPAGPGEPRSPGGPWGGVGEGTEVTPAAGHHPGMGTGAVSPEVAAAQNRPCQHVGMGDKCPVSPLPRRGHGFLARTGRREIWGPTLGPAMPSAPGKPRLPGAPCEGREKGQCGDTG